MSPDDVSAELVTLRVPEAAKGARLDAFLAEHLAPDVSRAKVQTWIKDGQCVVNGRVSAKPNLKLSGGEAIELACPREPSPLAPSAGELTVVYRDADLAVLRKPAGLTVHPAPGVSGETLVNRLLHHIPELAQMEGLRPGIVHRLDKDTSGLMLVALAEPTRLALSEAFAAREVAKTYLALVHGVPSPPRGMVREPIGRDPDHRTRMAVLSEAHGGRPARSSYRVLWTAPGGIASLVGVAIHTGRTHQIRVHMAHLGHPLLGDGVYGSRQEAEFGREHPEIARLCARQMLHAQTLAFSHPATGEELSFVAPPPADFRRVALHLARRVQRVGLTGSPGSGKSALARELTVRGVPVFSADVAVAELYAPGADGWQLLRGRFGERVVPADDKPVDKLALAELMASSEAARREVAEMVHPLVRHRMELFFQAHAQQRLAVAEIPLLFETGWRSGDLDAGLQNDPKAAFDVVVAVSSPEELRRSRIMQGRGVSEELWATLESWQWPQQAKLQAADLVVDNAGSLEALSAAAEDLLADLGRRRCARLRALAVHLEAIYRLPGAGVLD